MSQINDENATHGMPTEELAEEQRQKLFDEGFSSGESEEKPGESEAEDGHGETERPPQDRPGEGQEPPQLPLEPVSPAASVPPQGVPDQPPAMPEDIPERPAPAPRPEPEQPPVKTVEAPEHIADELEKLKKLNPDAAVLALEDSPDGAAIRSRLELYGAELAQDRAERVLWQRREDRQRRQAELDRMERAREAHNAAFMSTLRRDHPEYMSMVCDPARKAEAAQYQQSVFDWIAAKPYAEAARLMEVARNGRDPNQVSALISQFERERGGKSKHPDPTGALAVPGRGAPVAPTGIGDKDDFDSGWNL